VDMGLIKSSIPGLSDFPDSKDITNLNEFIPAASADFVFYEHKLNLSIPQKFLKHRVHGEVDFELFDEGINAGILNYTITGSENKTSNGHASSLFSNLRSGINMGAWRLRNYSTWSMRKSSNRKTEDFNAINTYLQRNIRMLGSRLIIGDFPTDGDVFESTSVRGIQIETDEGMIPDVLRSYSPVIRGIADSNAQVTVRQNGNIIYQSNVPQGAFEITDLNPSSLSGDLDVTITESNGFERHFVQAYSSLAVMRREGQSKYSVTVGRLSADRSNHDDSLFTQGTVLYGAGAGLTPYTGVIVASNYKSFAAGLGVSLGHMGAFSSDVTYAESLDADKHQLKGQSYQFRYAKTLAETGTALSLAAYRYSTKNYRTLTESYRKTNDTSDSQTGKRNELQLMLNQALGNYGSIYLSGSRQSYWDRKDADLTFNAGYNSSFRNVSYGINLSRTHTANSRNDSRAALNISVPFDVFTSAFKDNNLRATYSGSTDQHKHATHNLGLSGNALDDHNLAYSINQSYQEQNHSNGGSVSTTYTGNHAIANAGYQYTEDNRQINFGLSGGVIAHQNGIVFSQPLGETVALVKAPGASHVKVANQSGTYTDYRGYAVVTSISPFRKTEVDLNPGTAESSTDISLTSAFVIPTRGAVVVADYKTKQGEKVLFDLTHDGKPVPFGATVSLTGAHADENNSSMVGDAGQVYMSGMPEEGNLKVSWGRRNDQQCNVAYHIPSKGKMSGRRLPSHLTAVCQ
ncbi:fimbrial biogenesis outer membrane usher protein, partial [Salmonella enterica]|nr:fimbrial biogenesis outer membrane usher protein [Salmonella enterica]